jgi:hypothetical protein
VLLRHQAHPRSELSSLAEGCAVADRSYDRSGYQWADSRDLAQPPEHASIPMSEVCMFAVNLISCFWVNFFFNSTLPLSPRATR